MSVPTMAADGVQTPLRCEQNEGLGGLVITGLEASSDPTTVAAFVPLAAPVTAEDVSVARLGGEPVGMQAPVGTGMQAVWTADGAQRHATIIVAGDCVGTGVLGMTQLVHMAAAYTGEDELDTPYFMAVDFVPDGRISLGDLVHEAELIREETLEISAEEKQQIIDAAVALQTSGGTYHADSFDVVKLHAGEVIFGMLPGQSAFYTDFATVAACGGSYLEMYDKLQMLPHPEFGYREQLGVYTVKTDMWVATGQCLANSVIDGQEAGAGGGTQYVIPDYEQTLELTQTVDLHA